MEAHSAIEQDLIGRGVRGTKGQRSRRVSLLAMTIGAALAWSAPAGAQTAGSYVRAKAGAVVRVYQDAQSNAVATLAANDLLLVHGQEVGFYEVSSPDGFPVWVYGQYLSKTGTDGVYKVSGSGVRMRPRPDSSVDSYPLPTKLNRGDLVKYIERADKNAAFDSDWIKVWSVPRAHGWVKSSEVALEANSAGAKSEWDGSLRNLPDVALPSVDPSVEPTSKPALTVPAKPNVAAAPVKQDDKPAPAAKIPEEAYRSLAYGKTLLAGAIKKGKRAAAADFDPAIRAFETVLAMVPKGTIVEAEAAERHKEARTHQIMAEARGELALVEARQREMMAEWAEAKRTAELEKTAHWGRFMGRGWVESQGRGKNTRHFLRWGGERVFEISCDSGRYDLDLFEGYELGVRGTTLRAATMATDDIPAELALLDISRLEVISGTSTR